MDLDPQKLVQVEATWSLEGGLCHDLLHFTPFSTLISLSLVTRQVTPHLVIHSPHVTLGHVTVGRGPFLF